MNSRHMQLVPYSQLAGGHVHDAKVVFYSLPTSNYILPNDLSEFSEFLHVWKARLA
jgi:hypothetical protein